MADTRDLLIEIGTEELPPVALTRLIHAFAENLGDELERAGLAFDKLERFATPRRLALLVHAVADRQADKSTERRGPKAELAYGEDGKPSRAAEGFARSCGTTVDQLGIIETDKGKWLGFTVNEPGSPTAALAAGMIERALAKLPIPKRMRWGDFDAEFVRPVRWVVLLFGNEVIDAEILGVRTGRVSTGHRFHAPDPIELTEPGSYGETMRQAGHVIADFAERRALIAGQVAAAAERLGGEAIVSEALLDEVTALVEWPEPISGGFDEEFLALPREVLIASMQDHQKYFPVARGGDLLPAFITIANLASSDPAAIADGNERVIRPRLKDAAFFWEQDQRRPLHDRLADQQRIVFQEKLGSLHDKTLRVEALARIIAPATGAAEGDAARAAQLSRCDLGTEMVGEFPELQGTMGAYYAESSGEPAAVASALGEFYRPRFAGDALPASPTGQAIALADRLDTLVGIFAVGMEPTGDKDPYALRRAALGALRICIEHELDLDLKPLLAEAIAALPAGLVDDAGALADKVTGFLLDRLRGYYGDRGVSSDTIEAVLVRQLSGPRDIDLRMQAVTRFRALPAAASLAQANKRAGNLLRKAGDAPPSTINEARLADAAERELFAAISAKQDALGPRLAEQDYSGVLVELAGLKEPVDAFFDSVMVMAEDAELRSNRLALLAWLHDMFLEVADISILKPET